MAAFTKAHFAWQDEQSGMEPAEGEIPAEVPVEAAPEPEVAEEPTVEEPQGEPEDLPEEESLTPESLNALLGANEALKTALDTDPKAKGALFEMARRNAKLAPLGDLFPNVDTAKFALETSNRTVAIKTAFLQAADDPAQIGSAFDVFANEFREYDAEGKPAVDAQGNPVFGKDFDMLANHMVGSYFDGEISDLQERIQSGKFPNERAKDNAEALLQAYQFIKAAKDADPSEFERPDTSEMTPEQKAYFDKQQAEIDAEKERLGLKEKTQNVEATKRARADGNNRAARLASGNFYGQIDRVVDELRSQNVRMPEFAIDMVNPATTVQAGDKGVSFFKQAIYGKFLKEYKANGKLQNELALLEMQPVTEQSIQQRVEHFMQFASERLPVLVRREVAELQKSERVKRLAQQNKAEAARSGVQPEPRSGSAPKPTTMTWEKAAEQAKAEVAKEAGNGFLSDADMDKLRTKKILKLMS